MNTFFHSNSWQFRLLRTIAQGLIGVLIANLDILLGSFAIDATLKPVIVAAVMAVLSPIMASLGEATDISELEDDL